MALTNEALGKLLEPYGFEFNAEGDYFWTWCREVKAYRDAEGDAAIFIAVELTDQGQFVRFVAPKLYDLSKCAARGAAMQAALETCFRTKAVAYEYQRDTGELRVTLEFPIGSGTLTERQLCRCMHLLISIADAADPVIRHAMATGTIDWALYETVPKDPAKEQMAELLDKVGGIEGLRKLAARNSPKSPGTPE